MSDNYMSDSRSDTWEGWIAAFNIFAKYHKPHMGTRPDAVWFAAEHDILYLPATPTPIKRERDIHGEVVCQWADEATKADAEQLLSLGFHWSTDADCWAKFT